MAHLLADFYRGKRVLVTGHTGFLGGWTVAWLKSLGAQVCGYGLPPASRPNFFDATLLDRGITSIFADLRDRNSLASAFAEHQPEIVIHCARRGNSNFSERVPVETFSTNVMGTVHILEEARLTASVRALVVVSQVPDGTLRPPSLDPRGEPSDVGDASIVAAEIVTSAFSKSFFAESRTAAAIARVADCYGGGDWREGRLIPKLVRSLSCDEDVAVHEERDLKLWHVLDPVHACLSIGKQLFECGASSSDTRAFGPDHDAAVAPAQIAAKFAKLWEAEETRAVTRENGRCLTVDEFETQLGGSNVLSPDKTLAWTVDWYRAYYTEPASVWRITDEQISRYMEMAPANQQPSLKA